MVLKVDNSGAVDLANIGRPEVERITWRQECSSSYVKRARLSLLLLLPSLNVIFLVMSFSNHRQAVDSS